MAILNMGREITSLPGPMGLPQVLGVLGVPRSQEFRAIVAMVTGTLPDHLSTSGGAEMDARTTARVGNLQTTLLTGIAATLYGEANWISRYC